MKRIRKWIQSWADSKRWRYVGVVEGHTYIVNEEGERIPGSTKMGYWILSERGDGLRRSEAVGNSGHSAFAEDRRMQVKVWRAGGPLPDVLMRTKPTPGGELVLFSGGKEGA